MDHVLLIVMLPCQPAANTIMPAGTVNFYALKTLCQAERGFFVTVSHAITDAQAVR